MQLAAELGTAALPPALHIEHFTLPSQFQLRTCLFFHVLHALPTGVAITPVTWQGWHLAPSSLQTPGNSFLCCWLMGHVLKHHVLLPRLEFQGSDTANGTRQEKGREGNVALQPNTTATQIEMTPSTEVLAVARPCCHVGGYRAFSALWGFVHFADFN